MSDSVEHQVAIEQAAKWLQAWSVDQAYIASGQAIGSDRRKHYQARAEALADAARDILTSDVWDLGGFMRDDGSYPERRNTYTDSSIGAI